MSRKLFVASTLSLAVSLALAGASAHALGVGGMRVQSGLNQPFAGEIDLLDVKPDELDSIKAQIASVSEFGKAGAERYHYLTKLRFTPQISPRGHTVVRVSSREPIREPYMDFLMEVQWPKGRLVREYTVLLDPPVTAGRSAPRVEQPVAQPRPVRGEPKAQADTPVRPPAPPAVPQAEPIADRVAERPRKSAPPPRESAPNAVPVAVPAAASGGGFPKFIGPVPSGSGLWRLALRNTPKGATVAQTAMALYRNNQGAFIRGDIDRLSAGKTLVIPSAAELFALEPEIAQREMEAALRGEKVRRAPIAPATGPVPTAPDGQSRLRIAGTAPQGAKPGTPGAPAGEGMAQELLLVREASESARQETEEMRGRIRELEAQLGEIQKLLQLRNAELARIQQGAPAAGDAPAGAPEPLPPGLEGPLSAVGGLPPEGPVVAVNEPTTPITLPGQLPGAVPTPEAASAGAGAPAGTVPGGPVPGATAPVAAAPGESPTGDAPDTGTAALPVGSAQTAPVAKPPAVPAVEGAKPKPPAPKPVQTPSPKIPVQVPDETADDSTWRALLLPLAGIAGVTALGIGALTWWRSRRRRVAEDSSTELDSAELFEESAPAGVQGPSTQVVHKPRAAGSAVDSEDFAGVDTPSSAFASFGRVEPETDEADVISEADIYIAYGRYREAEDLLREEIARSPDRLDLKLKLAEAYFGAKNRQGLQALMQDIQARGAGRIDAEQWQRLNEMSAAIQSDEAPSGSARPAGGLSGAGPAVVQAQGPATREASVDSLDLGSNEVLSLDIGDMQHPSSGRARASGTHSREPMSADLTLDRGGRAPSTPSPLASPPGSGQASGQGSRPRAPILGDEGPLLMDEEAFSQHFDLDADLDDLDLDRPATAAKGRDRPRPGGERPFSGGVSDLELTIDDLRAASDVDLESFVDTTQTTRADDERLAPTELAPPRLAKPLRSVAVEPAAPQRPSVMTGLFGNQDDGASSDLLSSQWQMDSGLWDETATKLDLARAYIEMGDKESARGILEEVMGEGTEDQRVEAGELLRRIG
jgi:pilus assembly protein FimV